MTSDPSTDRHAAQLEALFGANVVGVATGEGDLVLEGNDEFLRIVDRPRADLSGGLSWRAITPSDQAERDTAAVRDVHRDGGALVLKDFERPDGRRVPVLAAVAATDLDPYRWIAVLIDLSRDERLRWLAESEAAIVSTLLEDAPIGFALIDPSLRFVRVNRELAAMNGRSPEEHEGRPVFDVVPDLRESAQAVLEQVLATGEPLRDVEIVGMTPADPGVEHTWLESFFPVRMPHGPVVGVAAIARDETRVRTLQRQLRTTLERQRGALARVQESLMPEAMPSVEGFDLAGTYQSAEDEVSLGGDWYDVVRAPDGRLVVSVGDAVGHGLTGVGVMARATSAVRAYVSEGHGPARVLTLLNRLLGTQQSAGLATAVVVAIDTVTGELEYASAGHPYPLLLPPAAGDAVALEAAQGALLGATDSSRYGSGWGRLEPGETLLLYTDGLIERREEALDVGQLRLTRALADEAAGADAGTVVRTALRACLEGRERTDDVCLLAVRRLGSGG